MSRPALRADLLPDDNPLRASGGTRGDERTNGQNGGGRSSTHETNRVVPELDSGRRRLLGERLFAAGERGRGRLAEPRGGSLEDAGSTASPGTSSGGGPSSPSDPSGPTPDGGGSAPNDGGTATGSGDATSPIAAGASRGTISFHYLLGVSGSTAGDSIALAGDNYTDLIASNYVAGVMYGHLITKFTPGMQFEKDYLYGSIFGQLLQENLATELYTSSSPLLDPSPDQQAVMGEGQGAPTKSTTTPPTWSTAPTARRASRSSTTSRFRRTSATRSPTAASQYTQVTPAPFNDKLYGPMLTAYFHFNDYVALQQIEPLAGYTPGWEPDYDNALTTFKALPGNFLDVVLNVAYNQGYYGPLLTSYSQKGASATAATVATVNDYSSAWGVNDTYQQYPYQVRYYLDQLYDNPAPMTGVVPDNHLVFRVAGLGSIFAGVFQTLAYVGPASAYSFISADQANAAFATASAKVLPAAPVTLDLSNASERALVFSLLEAAIATLETSLGTDFTATTLTAL